MFPNITNLSYNIVRHIFFVKQATCGLKFRKNEIPETETGLLAPLLTSGSKLQISQKKENLLSSPQQNENTHQPPPSLDSPSRLNDLCTLP